MEFMMIYKLLNPYNLQLKTKPTNLTPYDKNAKFHPFLFLGLIICICSGIQY